MTVGVSKTEVDATGCPPSAGAAFLDAPPLVVEPEEPLAVRCEVVLATAVAAPETSLKDPPSDKGASTGDKGDNTGKAAVCGVERTPPTVATASSSDGVPDAALEVFATGDVEMPAVCGIESTPPTVATASSSDGAPDAALEVFATGDVKLPAVCGIESTPPAVATASSSDGVLDAALGVFATGDVEMHAFSGFKAAFDAMSGFACTDDEVFSAGAALLPDQDPISRV